MLLAPPRPRNRVVPGSKLLASIVDSSDDAIIGKTLDGVIITVSLSVSPIRDARGKVVGASAIARDISDRLRIQDQARLASQYARSLIEATRDPLVTIGLEGKITEVNEATIQMTGVARGDLAGSDFSDCFTEPDLAREGYLQVLGQGFVTDYPLTIRHTGGELTEDYADRLDDTGRWYADRIQAATERMGKLIDDLLLLAQASRTDMDIEPVDLSAEVTAISAELHAREPGRAVRFAIHDGVRVTADRSLIRTVLQNLVENAWKFTAKRPDATIEFGTTTTPGRPGLLLRPRQRGRLRRRVHRQAVPAVPAAARGHRFPRHRPARLPSVIVRALAEAERQVRLAQLKDQLRQAQRPTAEPLP